MNYAHTENPREKLPESPYGMLVSYCDKVPTVDY